MRTWFGLLGRFIAQTSGTADGARRTAFVAPNAGHGVADALRGCEVAGSRHGVPGIGGAFPDARAGQCPPRRQPPDEHSRRATASWASPASGWTVAAKGFLTLPG